MAVSGVIEAVGRDQVSNDGTASWRVLVTPDTPTALAGGDSKRLLSLAFHIARAADPGPTSWAVAPIGVGDRVKLPLLRGGRYLRVSRATGCTVTVRMIGWVFDPNAPLT